MDHQNPEIARLFAAKQRRRARLAALPFPEKVQAVVRMQEHGCAGAARPRKKNQGVGAEIFREVNQFSPILPITCQP